MAVVRLAPKTTRSDIDDVWTLIHTEFGGVARQSRSGALLVAMEGDGPEAADAILALLTMHDHVGIDVVAL